MRILLTFLPLFLFLGGCSFLFMHGPPAGHEKLDYFDCDASGAAPAADGTWAVVDGLLVAAFVSSNNAANHSDHIGAAPVVISAALAAVHVASGVYGVVKMGKCADAREHLRQRIATSAVQNQRIIDELQRRLEAASASRQQSAAPAPTSNAPEPEHTQSTGPTPAPVIPTGSETQPGVERQEPSK